MPSVITRSTSRWMKNAFTVILSATATTPRSRLGPSMADVSSASPSSVGECMPAGIQHTTSVQGSGLKHADAASRPCCSTWRRKQPARLHSGSCCWKSYGQTSRLWSYTRRRASRSPAACHATQWRMTFLTMKCRMESHAPAHRHVWSCTTGSPTRSTAGRTADSRSPRQRTISFPSQLAARMESSSHMASCAHPQGMSLHLPSRLNREEEERLRRSCAQWRSVAKAGGSEC